MVKNKNGGKKTGGKEGDPGKLNSNNGYHFGKLKGSGCLARRKQGEPRESPESRDGGTAELCGNPPRAFSR